MANEEGGLMTCRNICWIAGGLLGLAVFLLIGKPWFWALIAGVIVAVVIALLLLRFFCSDMATSTSATASAPAPAPTPAPTPAPAAKPAPVVEATAAPAEPEPAPESAPEPTPEPEPAPAPAPAAAAAPAASDGPDDLKMIKGVGPGLEKKLNDAGVTRFAQIAAWTAADISEMDDKLSFRGRIERDDWVAQAKTLASGAETEFSKRAEKSGLYDKDA